MYASPLATTVSRSLCVRTRTSLRRRKDFDKAIVEAVSKEPSKRDSIAEQRIRDRLDETSKERNDLQQVFVRDFSNYAALSKPEPLTTKEIQALLDNDEALVVIDLDKYSYVWVITKDRAEWKELAINAEDVSKLVETLRAGLARPFR